MSKKTRQGKGDVAYDTFCDICDSVEAVGTDKKENKKVPPWPCCGNCRWWHTFSYQPTDSKAPIRISSFMYVDGYLTRPGKCAYEPQLVDRPHSMCCRFYTPARDEYQDPENLPITVEDELSAMSMSEYVSMVMRYLRLNM